MANKRFEMYQYRQILVRLGMGVNFAVNEGELPDLPSNQVKQTNNRSSAPILRINLLVLFT